MDAIMAGARAYLDMAADPQLVRQAIEVVVSGSIWAPRRLLSRLVDRLLPSLDRASNGSASTSPTASRRCWNSFWRAPIAKSPASWESSSAR